MTYINRIRKFCGTAGALWLTACMLFGCTRADVATSSGNAATGSQAVAPAAATGTVSEGSLAGAGSSQNAEAGSSQNVEAGSSQAGSAGSSQAGTGAAASSSADSQTKTPAAQNVSGTTTPAVQQVPAASQSSAPSQESAVPAAPAAPEAAASTPEEMEDAYAYEIGEEDAVESISGEFEKSDGTESVVLSLMNDNQISFQFRESGIGAYAEASGNTAVYTGDDGYSILFDVAGDTLAVSISGEDGDQSPMNGIYYRILDGGDDADGEQDADLQDAGLEDAEDLDDSVYADAQ